MNSYEEGMRTLAISHTIDDEDTVYVFGPGVYAGDVVPDPEKHGPLSRMAELMAAVGAPNPLIKLDDGGIVWGCECWWGPEDKSLEMIDGYTKRVTLEPPSGPPPEEAEDNDED